jgi:hypothetical protein
VSDSDLARFRTAVAGGLAHLESRRQEVNDLNVFPVADGDTGDNMALTLRAVLDELDRLQERYGSGSIDAVGRAEIVESVARAALLGARGNSGVILSQLIRGAAEELVSRPGELVDATLIGAAIANAASRAYDSVREPAEGTILTVAREIARMVASDVAHAEESTRLAEGTPAGEQDRAIADTLARGIIAGEEAVKRGPEQLAVLRDAGVVDAGGYGLTIIFAGVVAALRGEQPPELDHYAPAKLTHEHAEHTSSTYRYCTNFAVTGLDLSPERFVAPLEQLGDSVLVVGDSSTLKVHVHANDPELAVAVFDGVGEVSYVDVADMHAQVAERDQRLRGAASNGGGAGSANGAASANGDGSANGATSANGTAQTGKWPKVGKQARCGVLAVVSGEGLKQLFREQGAHVIDGGPTLNPATNELLAGIHEIDADEVIVLPGSPNVVMAAERAAELSERSVEVVKALSLQAGLAAAVALMPERGARENAEAMEAAIAELRIGGVAEAARADAQGRFAEGDAVGFVEGEVVAWGDPGETFLKILQELAPEAELVSVLAGEAPPLSFEQLEGIVDGTLEAELELRDGGQPAWWWLLSAE